jgi:hypothetical protein
LLVGQKGAKNIWDWFGGGERAALVPIKRVIWSRWLNVMFEVISVCG